MVAFSFGLSQPLSASTPNVNIPFDVVNIDTHNGWDTSSNTYVVQLSGIYVISYTVAAKPRQNCWVELQVNQNGAAALYIDGYTNGIEILSRTILLSLAVRDKLSATLIPTSGVYGDVQCQTNMNGFMYSPSRSIPPISWCIARGSPLLEIVGPMDPVSFDTIVVNQGSGWDAATNSFITPMTGVYYVHITAGFYGMMFSKMELLINGMPFICLYNILGSVQDTRSRSAIVRLKVGTKLRIRLPSSYTILSSDNFFVTFAGFRLYA